MRLAGVLMLNLEEVLVNVLVDKLVESFILKLVVKMDSGYDIELGL